MKPITLIKIDCVIGILHDNRTKITNQLLFNTILKEPNEEHGLLEKEDTVLTKRTMSY